VPMTSEMAVKISLEKAWMIMMYMASRMVKAINAAKAKYMPYKSFWLGGTSTCLTLPL